MRYLEYELWLYNGGHLRSCRLFFVMSSERLHQNRLVILIHWYPVLLIAEAYEDENLKYEHKCMNTNKY